VKQRRARSTWIILLTCVLVAFPAALALELILPERSGPPKKNSQRQRDNAEPGLTPGSAAPDFALPCVSDGHLLHLADMGKTKPAVLVFGGFT